MLRRVVPILAGVALGACSGTGKDSDTAPDMGTLMVTLVLDHEGCYEDPHDHAFEVNVYRMPEYVLAASFDASLDTTTGVDLSPGLYRLYGYAGWSPDGPSNPDWQSNCGCSATLSEAERDLHVGGSETLYVTVPVICGSTLPD